MYFTVKPSQYLSICSFLLHVIVLCAFFMHNELSPKDPLAHSKATLEYLNLLKIK